MCILQDKGTVCLLAEVAGVFLNPKTKQFRKEMTMKMTEKTKVAMWLMLFGAAAAVRAANVDYVGSEESGDPLDGASWASGSVPAATDGVRFGFAGATVFPVDTGLSYGPFYALDIDHETPTVVRFGAGAPTLSVSAFSAYNWAGTTLVGPGTVSLPNGVLSFAATNACLTLDGVTMNVKSFKTMQVTKSGQYLPSYNTLELKNGASLTATAASQVFPSGTIVVDNSTLKATGLQAWYAPGGNAYIVKNGGFLNTTIQLGPKARLVFIDGGTQATQANKVLTSGSVMAITNSVMPWGVNVDGNLTLNSESQFLVGDHSVFTNMNLVVGTDALVKIAGANTSHYLGGDLQVTGTNARVVLQDASAYWRRLDQLGFNATTIVDHASVSVAQFEGRLRNQTTVANTDGSTLLLRNGGVMDITFWRPSFRGTNFTLRIESGAKVRCIAGHRSGTRSDVALGDWIAMSHSQDSATPSFSPTISIAGEDSELCVTYADLVSDPRNRGCFEADTQEGTPDEGMSVLEFEVPQNVWTRGPINAAGNVRLGRCKVRVIVPTETRAGLMGRTTVPLVSAVYGTVSVADFEALEAHSELPYGTRLVLAEDGKSLCVEIDPDRSTVIKVK